MTKRGKPVHPAPTLRVQVRRTAVRLVVLATAAVAIGAGTEIRDRGVYQLYVGQRDVSAHLGQPDAELLAVHWSPEAPLTLRVTWCGHLIGVPDYQCPMHVPYTPRWVPAP